MSSITERSNRICEQRVNQLYLNHTHSRKTPCQEKQQPEQPGGEETKSQVAAGAFVFLPEQTEESPRTIVNTILLIHKIKATVKAEQSNTIMSEFSTF